MENERQILLLKTSEELDDLARNAPEALRPVILKFRAAALSMAIRMLDAAELNAAKNRDGRGK